MYVFPTRMMKTILFRLLPALLSAMLIITGFPAFSQGSLKAFNDTIDLVPGIPRVYDILANDSLPASDTLKNVIFLFNEIKCRVLHGSAWVFTFTAPYAGGLTEVTGVYTLRTMTGDTCSAPILFRIHEKGFDYLDINNVRARFNAMGSHFFGNPPEYEVPKGSGKTSVFLNSLWIGGKDIQKQLHFAGAKYGEGGTGRSWYMFDFYPGPVMDSSAYSYSTDTLWNHIWNLKRTDIDYHRAHFWEAGYRPIQNILTWPGNGDTTLGQAWKLAPFCDRNGDGRYDPFDGDYPEIRGDQALWFIFNDDRAYHYESQGAKLGIEVHGMAYAFDIPEDTAFKNTVFLNYRIFNRSQNTYDSALFGIFTDIDLGYYADDRIGCDVERNMYFCYNAKPVDGTGQTNAYGTNPPAQSAILLGGALMDADGIDNPRYGNTGAQLCDASVNGLKFGDSIADNERLGMQRFLFPYPNALWPLILDPTNAQNYYDAMCGIFRDGNRMVYGGNGHPDYGGYGPGCNFMFPGESDTLNWGTGCTLPNGPVGWTEETAGFYQGDRTGVGITGPVTFKSGDMQELDIAFTWARDYINPDPHASVDKLRILTDHIRKSFETNALPNGGPFYGIAETAQAGGISVKIYPNPASEQVTIELCDDTPGANKTIVLLSVGGHCIMKTIETRDQKTITLDISEIPAGIYFIRITTNETSLVKKLVVM